ncbi:hypothetical protein AGMMS4956_21640 [Bacteroidia bacterium]|nr:hypothetical protein AGMMS4956_21640 [Bacteroidia bacterium]
MKKDKIKKKVLKQKSEAVKNYEVKERKNIKGKVSEVSMNDKEIDGGVVGIGNIDKRKSGDKRQSCIRIC